MSVKNPVKTLNAEVARKIAAGEVIDRPNAIVREFLDNSIDSGADSITVEISGGGIEKIRVVDNGSGMTKEDLENSARPHSTSKISTETDLLNLSTLGFRGEALASIAAVSRLSINSGGWKMRASITEDHIIEKTPEYEGTIVQSEGLFENFPARRLFLKRPATEGTLCKNTFIEKSLPKPEIAFRFISDGEIKIDLPKNQTLKERFLSANEIREDKNLFYQVEGKSGGTNPDWSFKIIIGEPGVRRPNKKDISVFVNGRKIQEYALVQAIEYGGQGYFPNGSFPVAAAFIQINPSLVDFNIHPAKKEVKFKDISPLHHGISQTLRAFFSEYTNTNIKLEEERISQSRDGRNIAERSPGLFSGETFFSGGADSEKDRTEPSVFPSLWKNASRPRNLYSSERNMYYAKNTYSEEHSSSESSLSASEIFEKAARERENEKKQNAMKISSAMDEIIRNYTGKSVSEEKSAKKTTELFISEKTPPYLSSAKYEGSAKDGIYEKAGGLSSPENSLSEKDDFHYLGCALGTFIVAEKNNALYIIDQHAAHERMIFDKIMAEKDKCQSLLIPYIIETKDENEDKYLESIKNELLKIGFACQNKGNGRWEFSTLNERWKGTEEDLEHAIFDKKVAPKDLIYSIAAMTSCKAAVKDGWKLLDDTAEEIARGALNLPDPHCPHGRPCYHAISREELFRLVRRTE